MKIERIKNATRNIVFGTVLKIYQILIPFLMRTVMIYFMGVQYLGLNSLFTSILQVLNLAELGVGSAMVYSMYKPIAEDDSKSICALMRLYRTYYRGIGAVIAVVGVVMTPLIPHLINSSLPPELNIYVLYLLNLAATVLSYWLFAYKNALFQAHQRTDITSKVTLLTSTIQYGAQIFVIACLKDYYIFVMVALATQILTNLITAIAATKMYPQYHAEGKLKVEDIQQINRKIKDLFTAKLGATIVNSADTIVISAFLGLTMLAVYQNYYYIMSSVVAFILIFLSSCTAGIGNSLAIETLDKNYKDFKKLMFLLAWIVAICVCCFLCAYQPFMTIWVGEDFLLPFSCVILFCIYFYCYVMNHLFCTYKDAAGLWHEDRFRPLIAAMINLVLNLLMVNRYGIHAILLSTILSYILVAMPWLIYNVFTVLFKRSYKEILKNLISYIVVTIMSASITYLIAERMPGSGVINLVIRLVVCQIFPNIMFIICFRNKTEFSEAVDLVDKVTKYKFTKFLKKIQ